MSTGKRQRILLIDDDEELINELKDKLLEIPEVTDAAEVVVWVPSSKDEDPDKALARNAPDGTAMVVTDYDLTTKGMRGFQGSAVESWCQRKLIPVGDFSRGNQAALPKEPNLFGMKIPIESSAITAQYVAAAYLGFRSIRTAITGLDLKSRSISAITAEILGRGSYEPAISLYFSRLASSNTAIREHLQHRESKSENNDREDTLDIIAYVIGHVLLNLILAFPGPILSREVLAAYLSVSEQEAEEIVGLAQIPGYEGPFAGVQPFVWREDVDNLLAAVVDDSKNDPPEDSELYNRFAAELVLKRPASNHICSRQGCGGRRGGCWCPFTKRPVCLREDCSEAATAWIPDGADLCRVERDFFEELAPLLGL